MTKEKILLVGGGGHCKSCIEVVESTNAYDIVGIIDQPSKIGEEICGYKIIGCDDDLPTFFPEVKNVLITIGQIKNNTLRKKVFHQAKEIGFVFPSIIASTAYLSKHTLLKEGSIIMHQAFVNSGVTIGENTIINSKALLEHDVEIGSHSHISTAVIINGDVIIGHNTFIGSNTCINQGISIGDNCVIASQSVIRKNITEPGMYYTSNLLNKK